MSKYWQVGIFDWLVSNRYWQWGIFDWLIGPYSLKIIVNNQHEWFISDSLSASFPVLWFNPPPWLHRVHDQVSHDYDDWNIFWFLGLDGENFADLAKFFQVILYFKHVWITDIQQSSFLHTTNRRIRRIFCFYFPTEKYNLCIDLTQYA